MDRVDLDRAWAPLEPIQWPTGGEQPVRRLTWRIERLLPTLTSGDEAAIDAVLPTIMTAILPGRTWDEIQDTLDGETMRDLITYASREYERAMRALEQHAGNSAAGAAPASPPPTPPVPSSPASPELIVVPCGAS